MVASGGALLLILQFHPLTHVRDVNDHFRPSLSSLFLQQRDVKEEATAGGHRAERLDIAY